MSPARRIAFVSPRFADGPTVGGAETLLRALADRLAAAGREVHFLTTCARNHFTWANELPAGSRRVGALEVHWFPVDERCDLAAFLDAQGRISRGAAVSEADEEAWLRNNVSSSALIAHLRSHAGGYDRVIVGPYLFGLTVAVAEAAPDRTLLVPCLHDEPFAYLRFCRRLFHGVRSLLFNAEPERDLALRLYGVPPERVRIVGMGLDPFDAEAGAFARRRDLSQPYLLYSGRREPLKGTPLLLDYFAAFRERTGTDLKLVLTGSGQVDIPPAVAPHVLDVGFLSEAEKREAMAGAVAFCHPSINESLSIVLLESWLARTPALVHARSAVLSWQCRRSGGGLWFRFYPEFEEELLALLGHPDLRAKLGAAGREFVLREYAWPAVEPRLLAAVDA